MVMIPFDDLNIKIQKRNKKTSKTVFKNTGLDTETYQGYCRLICDDSGRFEYLKNFEDILKFLTHSRFRNSFNWFFNIRFDFESIIKLIDDINILTDLYNNKWIKYDNYKISYLDGKYINIIDDNNHSFHYYDVANFFQTSLNEASKKYLNKTKNDNINSAQLNIDLDYWLKNKEEIIKYCIQDAILTKQIADYLLNLMKKSVNFIPLKMYSKGSYSQEYFLKNCYIPTINNIDPNVLKYAYNSYSGGRFELIQRGYFDNSYTYDIKSAYPYQMANLIDITKGKWQYTKAYRDNAYYGYYLCNIIYYDEILSPFMQRVSGLNIYPNGIFQQYLTQNEIYFIRNNFNTVDIEVIDGYVFYPTKEIFPLRNKILDLYFWKERETDEDIKYMVKIILNSLYGKFIQKVGGNTGSLFNPMYAAEITANTRLELLNFVLNNNVGKNKILKNLIGFSTDSVHSRIKLSETNNNPDWQNLGDFKLDFEGRGIFIMSDIYSVWNKKEKKDKFRGFSIKIDGESTNIQQICGKSILEPKYNYYQFRPMHLGESLKRIDHDYKKVNVWSRMQKTIDLNGDMKRLWDKNFETGWDCFIENHQSIPICFG
jgi:hypothetical protein